MTSLRAGAFARAVAGAASRDRSTCARSGSGLRLRLEWQIGAPHQLAFVRLGRKIGSPSCEHVFLETLPDPGQHLAACLLDLAPLLLGNGMGSDADRPFEIVQVKMFALLAEETGQIADRSLLVRW